MQDKTTTRCKRAPSLPSFPQAPPGLAPPNLNASNLGFVTTTGSLCADDEGGACPPFVGGEDEGTRTIKRVARLFVFGERGAR